MRITNAAVALDQAPATPASSLRELHDGKLEEDDRDGVHCEDDADLPLVDVRDVLPESREDLEDERDPHRHERGVEEREAREDPILQHGSPAAARALFVERRCGDEHEQDKEVREERRAVDREEHGEAAGIADDGDRARGDAAERDAEIHCEALQRVRRRAFRRRREARQHRRLGRPE
jgi:hypothetical protein